MNTVTSQVIPQSSIDNAVVYFLNQSASSNSLVREIILVDSKSYIGTLCMNDYIRYECKAGYHLFWSRSTMSNDYIEAELAAGKVYFVDILVDYGQKDVYLSPIDPDLEYKLDPTLRFISSQPAKEINDKKIQRRQKLYRKKIEKGLMLFEDYKKKGRRPHKLTKDMYYKQSWGKF